MCRQCVDNEIDQLFCQMKSIASAAFFVLSTFILYKKVLCQSSYAYIYMYMCDWSMETKSYVLLSLILVSAQ